MKPAIITHRKLAVLSLVRDGTGTHTALQASAVPGMKTRILREAPPALEAPDVQALAQASSAADTANVFKPSSGLMANLNLHVMPKEDKEANQCLRDQIAPRK